MYENILPGRIGRYGVQQQQPDLTSKTATKPIVNQSRTENVARISVHWTVKSDTTTTQ